MNEDILTGHEVGLIAIVLLVVLVGLGGFMVGLMLSDQRHERAKIR